MPLRASEKWLNTVLQEKAHWVVEKLDGWQTQRPATCRWQDGESIDYLGEQLELRVVQGLFATPAHRRGRELWVFVVNDGETARIRQAVSCWYQDEAEQYFAQRVVHYTPLLNVVPHAVKLSEAKAQWGSCAVNGTVRLNVHLIKLPPRLIDYVVVHELAHLRELNHSVAFWRVVESVCPEYVSLRSELRGIFIR